jgi:hypothetical protein
MHKNQTLAGVKSNAEFTRDSSKRHKKGGRLAASFAREITRYC